MPELPEVENVKLSLRSLGAVGQTFSRVELLRKDLRTPLKKELANKLPGQRILSLERRAKYLLFETQDYSLLSHLGMTGSWRSYQGEIHRDEIQKHDHVIWHFDSGLKLVYNDPRRFGIMELIDKKKQQSWRWLKHLGVEPLSEEFNGDFLYQRTRKRKAPIKGFLMDQRHVVGVGNIYASEALFAAKIKPLRAAGRLTKDESADIVKSIREVLRQAIAAGGSTISDYRNPYGESGAFQNYFSVYDRSKAPCPACGEAIRSKVIAGRNTFWCPKCQR
jgi:formamidopyrimidine-DNA glycosylase